MEHNTICNTCKQEHEGVLYRCKSCKSWDIYHVNKNPGISKQDIQTFKESLRRQQ